MGLSFRTPSEFIRESAQLVDSDSNSEEPPSSLAQSVDFHNSPVDRPSEPVQPLALFRDASDLATNQQQPNIGGDLSPINSDQFGQEDLIIQEPRQDFIRPFNSEQEASECSTDQENQSPQQLISGPSLEQEALPTPETPTQPLSRSMSHWPAN